MHRHAPMVWGVCRRLLSHLQDAEDAFQATFLILARKAASVVPRAAVGAWLHGVAYNTALKARAASFKRAQKEKQVEIMPERATLQQDVTRELLALLDQELNRLPAKYRLAVVLCELEGRSRKEAARQLDIPEGTLSSRLTTARNMLAKRLTRHGVTLSGAALAGILSQSVASAAVPTTVVSSAIRVATLVGAGHTAAAGVISAKVAALTDGVIKAMLLAKLKLAAAVVLLVVLTGVGLGFGYRLVPSVLGQESADKKEAPNEIEPNAKGNGVGALVPIRPDQTKPPAAMPAKVAADWRNAATTTGWMRVDEFGYLQVVPDTEGSGDLLAFRFLPWNKGMLAKLPDPAMPFGLDLNSLQLTDADLKELAAFKGLHSLNLYRTPVTNVGLKELAGHHKLHTLALQDTKVTGAGLKELAGLKILQRLFLSNAQVTNELGELNSLRALHLFGADITDASLKEVCNGSYYFIQWFLMRA